MYQDNLRRDDRRQDDRRGGERDRNYRRDDRRDHPSRDERPRDDRDRRDSRPAQRPNTSIDRDQTSRPPSTSIKQTPPATSTQINTPIISNPIVQPVNPTQQEFYLYSYPLLDTVKQDRLIMEYSVKSAAVEVKLAKARKDEYELDALAIEHQRWDVQAQVLTEIVQEIDRELFAVRKEA